MVERNIALADMVCQQLEFPHLNFELYPDCDICPAQVMVREVQPGQAWADWPGAPTTASW